ncbi:MAG: hypothetical protein KKF52_04455 [Nanoarchaeota archaeon]|nr:hypothetical protein [Nanoarchaeota archaeon]MBU4242456.1 hypothetical protein [Nanoarchaeota archaeon]MBU4352429.1 hypothetical protein [Nanoarchaeota archaeon]
MDRKKQIEDFLIEMDTKYEVRDKFKQQIKPMAYGLDHPNISDEQFPKLLDRIEESYKRHIEIQDNGKKSLEGLAKIKENVDKISQGFQEIQKGTKQINESLEKINEIPKKLVDALIELGDTFKEQEKAYTSLLKNPKGDC